MSPLIERIHCDARKSTKQGGTKPRILLGDATDIRILEAASIAREQSFAEIALIGERDAIEREARAARISIEGIEIYSASTDTRTEMLAKHYFERRAGKIASIELAMEEVRGNALLFGALLAASGAADGMIAGSRSTTADVIRAALKGIGLAERVSTLSSLFLFAFPPIAGLREEPYSAAFADCAVLVEPDATQLADVAIQTAKTFRTLSGDDPRVAMLSFSTKGSAMVESTLKVAMATELARKKAPALSIDGELQFDAAFVPAVAARKASGSEVAGRANVFIFPNLDAGNIAYKIAERLGRGEAMGPILQGLRIPMNDLSRGASVSDIVNMIAVTVLQAGENQDYG